MTKTQVQLPDDLYRDTKAIARKYEMSFAEVVRRGLEHMRLHYPIGKKGAEFGNRRNRGVWDGRDCLLTNSRMLHK